MNSNSVDCYALTAGCLKFNAFVVVFKSCSKVLQLLEFVCLLVQSLKLDCVKLVLHSFSNYLCFSVLRLK